MSIILDLISSYQTILSNQIYFLETEIKGLKKQIPEGLIVIITKLSNYSTIQLNIKEIDAFEKVLNQKKFIYFCLKDGLNS